MKILGVAHAIPSLRVTNTEIIREIIERNRERFSIRELKFLESMIRRFFKVSGTETRFHRNSGERAAEFALQAGQKAMEKASVDPSDVDLLIYTGVGRGWVEPATANLFQHTLGLSKATCFDVLDACASWIRGMSIAKSFLDQGIYRLVMVLNCEFNFREYANFEFTNLKDLASAFSAFTMGEAATATIVSGEKPESGDEDAVFSFRSWGEKHGLCKIPLPNASDYSVSQEDGLKPMSFFTAPAELLSFTIKRLVNHFWETEPVANREHDLVITHSVSVSSAVTVLKQLGIDLCRLIETHARFGNTVSASLPLGLSVAEAEGRLERGMRVLMLMGSAGVTTAIGSFRY